MNDVVRMEMRQAIAGFEEQLGRKPQVHPQMHHHFSYGVYMREMRIPAGIELTGKIHKYPCQNIIIGDVAIITETGSEVINGPYVFKSPGGTKRAMRSITDIIWITVHANPDNVERSGDEMADILTVTSFDALSSIVQGE